MSSLPTAPQTRTWTSASAAESTSVVPRPPRQAALDDDIFSRGSLEPRCEAEEAASSSLPPLRCLRGPLTVRNEPGIGWPSCAPLFRLVKEGCHQKGAHGAAAAYVNLESRPV